MVLSDDDSANCCGTTKSLQNCVSCAQTLVWVSTNCMVRTGHIPISQKNSVPVFKQEILFFIIKAKDTAGHRQYFPHTSTLRSLDVCWLSSAHWSLRLFLFPASIEINLIYHLLFPAPFSARPVYEPGTWCLQGAKLILHATWSLVDWVCKHMWSREGWVVRGRLPHGSISHGVPLDESQMNANICGSSPRGQLEESNIHLMGIISSYHHTGSTTKLDRL